jgi:hypothetical protein
VVKNPADRPIGTSHAGVEPVLGALCPNKFGLPVPESGTIRLEDISLGMQRRFVVKHPERRSGALSVDAGGRRMIKDILVHLSYGTSQAGVSNYALSVAETFGAHIMGIAFAYHPIMAGGFDFSANFIRAQQAEAQERAESVATAFDEATRRAGISSETRRIEAAIGDVPTQFAHIARRFDLSRRWTI